MEHLGVPATSGCVWVCLGICKVCSSVRSITAVRIF